MKLTNGTMFDSILILRNVHETGKLGYACARNLRKLTDSAKEFMDVRDELLNKYGEPGEGGNFTLSGDSLAKFQKELGEYAVIEHEVDAYQVDEDVFCSGDLDNQQMFTLDWMVRKDEA